MFTGSNKKIVLIAGLSILFCILGCTGFVMLMNKVEEGSSQLPIRSLILTIDKSQREELFDQLRQFAEKHGFEFQLTDFNTNGENFQFWMSREDITITAANVPPDPKLVFIDFDRKYPGYPVDEEEVDQLLNDLKSFINEIPNVTITEP